MTDKERIYASLGYEYAEGIENCSKVELPSGRYIYKTDNGSWEVQPPNDNYWLLFDDLVDAIKCGKGIK